MDGERGIPRRRALLFAALGFAQLDPRDRAVDS